LLTPRTTWDGRSYELARNEQGGVIECLTKMGLEEGVQVPEETEEEGESIACPARAINDLNKHRLRIILIRLHDRQRNNQRQRSPNIENRIELY